MATWPASLPANMAIGAKDVRVQGFMRTKTDTGPSKQRRRFSATSRFIKGSMVLTKSQRETFESFYATDIDEGSTDFTWSDPIDFSAATFRFVEPPQFSAVAGGATGVSTWTMEMHVERLP
jgi:hypothetical protein